MARYVVSFYTEARGTASQVIEAATRELALRQYFDTNVTGYTKNNEGFVYFCEDFSDDERPMGAMVEI